MPRTYKRRTDEIEEFNDDALRLQESDSVDQAVSFSLEDDDVQALELGDRSRRSRREQSLRGQRCRTWSRVWSIADRRDQQRPAVDGAGL